MNRKGTRDNKIENDQKVKELEFNYYAYNWRQWACLIILLFYPYNWRY